MPSDSISMDGVFKDYFEDYTTRNIIKRDQMADVFKTRKVDYAGGRRTIYSTKVGRNQAVGPSGEDSAFYDAQNEQWVQFEIDQRKMTGRIRLTYEAMEDSKSSKGAFVNVYRDANDGLVDTFARRSSQLMSLDGRGVLALVNEADPTTNTTLIVDSPGGISGTAYGNRFISKNMVVALVNPATNALRVGSARQVTAVASAGTSVTVATAPTNGSDNDYVVMAASTGTTDVLDTSYERAWYGLVALFDDGTYRNNYFGVDRATFTQLQTYVNASTGPLSVDLVQRMADVVDERFEGTISLLAMHHSTRRVWLQLTEGDRMYTGKDLRNPDPGTNAFTQDDVTMGGVPVKGLRDLPLTMIFGIDQAGSELVEYVSEPGIWWNPGDGILHRVGTGTSARHAVEAVYFNRKQYHARYPGKNFRLDGVTGQTLTVVRAAGD